MANLLGEGFPEEIIKQIDQRQKIYGSGYNSPRQDENLIYLNSNTAWCKLVSSVNIDNQDILNNEYLGKIPNISGNKLASQFILFNGTDDINSKLRAGISENNSVINNSVYGVGGNELGLSPMMGIQNVNVKHENRGSIRTAKVKIKAFNRVQFEIIDTLYLRLGFSLLLEWGNSIYYDNNGNLTNNYTSVASSFLDPTNKIKFNSNGKDYSLDLTYLNFLRIIDSKRKSSFGNYDAMFAKVKNFHWSFNKDGSYDIDLDLISVGDIVESLKLNSFSGATLKTNETETPQKESIYTKLKRAQNTDLGKVLNEIVNKLNTNPSKLTTIYKEYNADVLDKLGILFANPLAIASDVGNFQYTKDGEISLKNLDMGFIDTKQIDGIKKIYNGVAKPQYYIRLGALLQVIQEKIIYIIGKENNSTTSLIVDYHSPTNLIYVDELQVSIDPTICLVNKNLNVYDGELHFIDGEKFIAENINAPSKSTYGYLMNIYINIEFILDKMEALKDDKNKLVLIDFLKGILDGVNTSLGGVNSFDIFIDETQNTLRIIDTNPIPDSNFIIKHVNKLLNENNKLNETFATFNFFGYNKDGTSGFVKDFSFKTEITPGMSTMISVSATSNGNVVGENATALSRLNKGLVDRFKENISSPNLEKLTKQDISAYRDPSLPPLPQEINVAYQELQQQYAGDYARFIGYLRELSSGKLNDEEKSSYADMLKNLIELRQQRDKKRLELKYGKNETIGISSGFIPFNLSLTMDGISGMKINSKFKLDTKYLPSNYPKTVDFLIKNLSHTISNNKWTTQLESYCISQGNFEAESNRVIDPKGQSKVNLYNPPKESKNNQILSCADEAKILLSQNYNLSQLSCNAIVAKYSIPKEGEQKIITPFPPLTRQNVIDNLTQVAQNILEPIRAKYPDLIVTNGYRNKGGKSQHEKGEAVDIQFSNILKKSKTLQQSEMVEVAKDIKQLLSTKNGFDQLLLEFKSTEGNPWIHISYKSLGNRNDYNTFLNDVLAKNGKNNLINPFV